MRYCTTHTILATLAIAGMTRAGIPSTGPAVGITNNDLLRVAVEFNHRTLSVAYTKIGRRNAKWDAAAIAFLDRLAVRFAEKMYGSFYASGIDVSDVTLLQLATSATSLGCDDPMVLCGKAGIAKESGDEATFETLISAAAPKLAESDYDAYQKYSAMRLLMQSSSIYLNGQQVIETKAKLDKLLAILLASPAIDPLERRVKMELALDIFNAIPAAGRANVLAGFDQEHGDQWTGLVLHGVDEVSLAWEARGNGFSNTVTQDGWKGFAEHLSKARDALKAAFAAEPTYPEPASEMITVAMALDDPNELTRNWFDRAKAAQIDYGRAWNAYSYALYPKWGGSHMQMYALGCEALRTGRFDTSLPQFLLQSLIDIAQDQHAGFALFKVPGVWKNVQAVCDGYIAEQSARTSPFWWKTREAAFAYRCGETVSAAKLLDALKTDADATAFKGLQITLDEVRPECEALASDAGQKVSQAIAFERVNDFASAEKLYQDILQRVHSDHPAWKFVSTHDQVCQIAAPLAAGKATAIPFTQPGDLNGWHGQMNGWSISDGSIIYAAKGKSESTIQHFITAPQDVRVKIEWSYADQATADRPGISVVVQNIEDRNGGTIEIIAFPEDRAVEIGNDKWMMPGSHRGRLSLTPNKWHSWVIQKKGNTLTLEQDGKALINQLENGWIPSGVPTIGLSVTTTAKGGTVKFRNMTLEPIAVGAKP